MIALVGSVLFFTDTASADTETPTPWSVSTWGITPSPFPMCTFTPAASSTIMFETPPPFAECPPCDMYGKDACGNTCTFVPSPTPTVTNTATARPTQMGGKYFESLGTSWGTYGGPYKHFHSTTTDCHLENSNRTIHCIATAEQHTSNVGSFPLNGTDAYFTLEFYVKPDTNGCVYMHTFGAQGNRPGSTAFTNISSANGCTVVSPTIYTSTWTDTEYTIGKTTVTTNRGRVTSMEEPEIGNTYKYISLNYYVSLDYEPTATPTASKTPTNTGTPGDCGGGIATPISGGGDPIIWINPPEVIAGECYTILPELMLPIPGLVTTIVNPILPEGWTIPEEIGFEGYRLCIDWLILNMSFMGVQYDGLLGVVAWMFVAGLIYKEIAS